MLQLGNEEAKKAEILEYEPREVNIIIPQCCREGHESCPHGVPKLKKKRRNKGL